MNLPLNIDIQQILLHMFNFLILFGGMYFILYSPVKKFMDAREKQYKEKNEETEKKLADAEKAKNEYESKLAFAEKECGEIKASAESEARNTASEIVAKANRDAEDIVSQANEKAKKTKEKIILSANEEIADMVANAAEKIVMGDSDTAYESFIDSVKGKH